MDMGKDKGLIFDVIDHSLLLQNLTANGISGAEHAWFFSYLINRKQFVQCNAVLKTQMRDLQSTMESPKDPYFPSPFLYTHQWRSVNNTRELRVSLR